MNRAAILIGIKNAGRGLQVLQAVDDGVAKMRAWIEAQPGFRGQDNKLRVEVLTDTVGPVTASSIFESVERFVDDQAGFDQLIIYFAGHGIAIQTDEFWLCSNAAKNPNEAINLASSCDYARYCGIPHVVFISDACRTPAQTISAQSINGSIIFPPPDVDMDEGTVDIFYATSLGQAALEVKAGMATGHKFDAIYTSVLTEALRGEIPEVLEVGALPTVKYVKPWTLFNYLKVAVPKRLSQFGVVNQAQRPRSFISSPPTSWIAEIAAVDKEAPVAKSGKPGTVKWFGDSKGFGFITPDEGTDLFAGFKEINVEGFKSLKEKVEVALNRTQRYVATKRINKNTAKHNKDLVTPSALEKFLKRLHSAKEIAPTHPPDRRLAPSCIVGFRIRDLFLPPTTRSRSRKNVHRVISESSVNVLVEFDDGYGALVASFPGYRIQIDYDVNKHEITHLSYTPSGFDRKLLSELRSLSRHTEQNTKHGTFQFRDQVHAEKYVESIVLSKAIDPPYCIYVALALHDIGLRDSIHRIDEHVAETLGVRLLDLYLLARRPASQKEFPKNILPLPLVARVWNLLDAKLSYPEHSFRFYNLRKHLTDSLWTVFNPDGVATLRTAITSGEIK